MSKAQNNFPFDANRNTRHTELSHCNAVTKLHEQEYRTTWFHDARKYIFIQKYMFYEQKKHSRNHQFLVVKRKKTHGITPAVRYFHYILACFFCVVFISICFIFHSISCFFLNITRRAPPFSLPNTKLQKSFDNTPKEETSDFAQRINNDYFAVYAIFIHTHNTLSDNPQAQKTQVLE